MIWLFMPLLWLQRTMPAGATCYSRTSYRFPRSLVLVYLVSLLLIALVLLNTYIRDFSDLVLSLPLPLSVKQWGIYHPEFGSGPLIPRSATVHHPNGSSEQHDIYSESIYVISLLRRHDRRIQMELLRTYLGLDWTYVEATPMEEEKVKMIMHNVKNLRKEAMRLQVLEQGQDLTSATSPDSTQASPSEEPSPSASRSPVVLPFMWPITPDGRVSNTLNSSANYSVLSFLAKFNVYAEPRSMPVPSTEPGSGPSSPVEPGLGPFDDAPIYQEPLVCATEDFSLTPYSPGLKPYRILTRARVACWHSHLSVISKIVDTNVARNDTNRHINIILEDDIDMEKDIRARLGSIWSILPTDWDVVFLGHCWSNESFYPAIFVPSESPPPNSGLIAAIHSAPTTLHRSRAPRCTHAYALSSQGARKLLSHLTYAPFAYSRAIDQAFAWLVESGRINAYSVVPSVIVQRKAEKSDVWEGNKVGGLVGSTWREGLVDGVFGT